MGRVGKSKDARREPSEVHRIPYDPELARDTIHDSPETRRNSVPYHIGTAPSASSFLSQEVLVQLLSGLLDLLAGKRSQRQDILYFGVARKPVELLG